MSFNCMLGEKCPRHNNIDEGGCPCFWEIPYENEQTGEQTIRKGCILSQEMGLPIVQSIVKAAHISSEHACQARNAFNDGFDRMTKAVEQVYQQGEVKDVQSTLPSK